MIRPLRRVGRAVPFLFWALLLVIWIAVQGRWGQS
jgi:hypothetical protein